MHNLLNVLLKVRNLKLSFVRLGIWGYMLGVGYSAELFSTMLTSGNNKKTDLEFEMYFHLIGGKKKKKRLEMK